ncbi:SDR family NAD(P)-dependent oxidoreductase [Streptomyces sp. PT12]|uniref:SDR family NAD(P)-dependent oxidoreductase n=1 Tax=Streptomyces sp. PT12 TaxID=1510197 RepID=UPI000DE5098C|nr:SDR family NAD(P)-dependent oxidoreductase [Streptomyces sp. PT12]RBM11805.1 polyketide synthase [Streptomyces sp. PT12]
MTKRAETYEKTFAGHDPFVAQHRAQGTGLLPAAVQLEMAMVGVARRRPFVPLELTDVSFLRPLAIADGATAPVRLDVTHVDRTRFELSTVLAGERKALSTGAGRLLGDGGPRPRVRRVTGTRHIDPEDLYGSWAGAGLDYGPDFRTVLDLTVGEGTALATLRSDAEPQPWHANPLLVDGVFQVVSCALQDLAPGGEPRLMLPIGVARLAVLSDLSAATTGVSVLARRTADEGAHATGDALVLGPSGEVVAEFTGVRMRRPALPGTAHRSSAGVPGPVSRIEWSRAAPPGTPREPATGTWVVVHDGHAGGLGERTAGHLRAEGARVVEAVLAPGAAPRAQDPDHRLLTAADEEDFRRLWASVGDEVTGVVHLGGCGPQRTQMTERAEGAERAEGTERAERAELDAGLYGCFAALKTLGERQRRARFLAVTRFAQPVTGDDRPVPARAALWGLVRTAAIEYPGLRPRLVDLDDASPDVLLAEVGDGPPEVGYRGGVRHEPVRVRTGPSAATARPIRRGGRYLILGGHGGLGLEVAARFAREGAGVVALVSRSGGAHVDRAQLARIEAPGCSVVSYAADIAAPGELRAVLERFRAEVGEPHGVVHAAGTLRDGLIRSATAEDIAEVMRSKVDGVRELAAAVAGLDLHFAVLFASVSGAFGNLGQAGYAAANAYLDAFAHARGAPWLSVDWGLWGEVGMGTAVAEQLRRRGVRPLRTAEALDALVAVLGGDRRQVVIAHPDASDALADDDTPRAAPGASPAQGDGGVSAGGADHERVEEELERFLTGRLGLASLDRVTPLADHGMSSIMSVEMSEELSRRWGVHLPATLFLEYGGFEELARALTERYGVAEALPEPAPEPEPEPAPAPVVPPAPAPSPRTGDHGAPSRPSGARPGDVAVVAASWNLPGAEDPDGTWSLFRSGGHAFTEIPAERWDIDAHFERRGPHMTGTYCRTGAFLSDIDRFDPTFFGISVREAEEMDAQQKLLLEHAWAVRDDSGLAGRRDIGVFVGATYTHHRDARGLETVGPYTALGSMNALLANRISYALDLTGPSQTVDTLCSSSLVAVQQAVAALREGRCGAAIVAASQVGLTPWYYRSLSQLGALSESRPHPFDARADGFVPGEGTVAVMLKRLADAERDGDPVWGVIRGAAVNHGGRGSALPVPRGEAQSEVIRAALDDASVAPADITLIETHGTATRLGDPIEIGALAEVFGGDPARGGPCHLGSVKANIGHLEPASGLAGLVKVLLCFRHREIPPLAGFETPGPHLDLSSGPFAIPTEPLPWHSDGPRRAGISAFGMGGTNAHIVVEEYVADRPAEQDAAPGALDEHLLVLSAHTPDALARRAAGILRMPRPETAAALCRSAAVGRDHRRHRVAVLGSTADELRAGLAWIVRRGGDADGAVLRADTVLTGGTAVTDTALIERLAALTSVGVERLTARLRVPESRLSSSLAAFHVAGGTVDWRKVYEGAPARRITLPPYPFRSAAEGTRRVEEEADDVVARLTGAHRVFGEPSVPGALPLALALRHTDVLGRVTFPVRGTGTHHLTGDLDDPARTGPAAFRYGERVVARIEPGAHEETPADTALDLDALRAELTRPLEPEGLYAWFEVKGMAIGAPLRSLTEVRHGTARVLARVDASSGGALERGAVALDAALQSMAVLTLADPAAPDGTYLPVSIGRVTRWGDPAQTTHVLLEADDTGTDRVRRGDAALLSADGGVLVRLSGIEYRTVTEPGARPSRPPSAEPAPVTGPAPRGEHREAAEAAVLAIVRRAFHDPGITPTTPLSSAGLDSLLATAIAADVEEAHGVPLNVADVLDSPDCRALAAAVAERAAEGTFAPPADEPSTQPPPEPAAEGPLAAPPPEPSAGAGTRRAASDAAREERDMAVIGFAFALPGAQDEEALWSLLAGSGTALRPAPAHRWGEYANGAEPDMGGFLDNVEEFDAEFFDFFPRQAEALDPQARWLLRTTWEALESAGLPPRQLPPATGVFVGASYQHYREYNIAPELDAHSGLGNHNAFLANRLSYFLDLRGPSMTIDTLCSSSLVALHTAVRSLREGECEQAIVAGVRVALSPLHYVAMRNLRALSPSGVVRAFDAGADGFVPGEGVVSVVVKPLGAALRDGDRVRGVVRGSAVNHGGRTSGLTVPSGGAQHEVVVAALRDAGVSAESIGLVEAHGTGTGLGDPIEVEGLTRAWRRFTDRSQFCGIGSVKSNIGHLEPAAGLAGLVKVLLALERGVVPASLHVRRPNDHVRFEGTPFFVVDRPWVWSRGGGVRRAAVSAFGMGGVNAHVVVEEAPPVVRGEPVVRGGYVVRVTGADERAVRALATAYADRFETARTARETADLCHTANVGRSALGFQTAVHGPDAAGIAAALRAVAAGTVPIARADAGLTAERDPGTDPRAVVDLVRAGYVHLDWAAVSPAGARTTDLPTYPFAQEKYWHVHRPVAPAPKRRGPEALRAGWRARELAAEPSALSGTVRLVTAEPGLGDALAAELRARGAVVVEPGRSADAVVVVDGSPAGKAQDLGAFWTELGALIRELPPHGRLLWAGVDGAAIHAGERAATRPETAAMAMAVSAACAESRRPCAVVHLASADPPEVWARQLAVEYAALHHGTGDTTVAYRGATRYEPETAAAEPGPPCRVSADGYYLVTGGLGAIGRRLAERLADRGARHIGIVGRSLADPGRSEALRELARRAEVAYLPCDVSDASALAAVAEEWGRRWGRLRGVVHCSGGVNPFGAMHRRPWSEAADVIAPKVQGSSNVVRLAKDRGADFVTLASSVAGAWPSAGRGLVDYSLANAYQLALAERENGAATAVTAHAWPNWTGVGMEADASFAAGNSLAADEAENAFFDHALTGGAVLFPGRAPAPAPAPVEATPVEATPTGAAGTGGAAGADERLGAVGEINAVIPTPATGRDRAAVRASVRDAFVSVLGVDPGERPLQDLGIDSLVIAELATALEQRVGHSVDPSLLMRASTADDIAAALARAADGAPPRAVAGATATGDRAAALGLLLRPLLDGDAGRTS